MYGRGGEKRKHNRHMRCVPTRGKRGTKRAVARDSSSPTADYFYKDGRRIQVGDCAVFNNPLDFPHFIGIIRDLSSEKEENLHLSVNKLYRPVELKLGKGVLLDVVPNEVFYTFHRHEIPAVSLLHPCKVAFLPKGVELPLGTSSFVCRRVFDADNRLLQWLTDQDYNDERQEEVDQLLYKTQIQMHATVHSGGRSPKPNNGPTQMSQLKTGSDNVQTSMSIPSQAKGRKRERADHGSEPIKRERSSKADDRDSGQFKSESILKFEISSITEKGGGLVNSEGVEKLVQLMQPNRVEKKLELVSRSMFASVIATTENFDCLSRFVQLKGLPVLDQWLQDVHKGKVRDGSPKDGDKSMEEFLFIMLHALDKLPVNLHALQMCNIGKSVNHLRTYKNSEIQKKARSLVDTWKKRVEAEMNVDTKSGSNQAVYAIKSPEQSSSAKIASSKPDQAEISTKLATSSPGPTKVVPLVKDGQPRSVVGSNPDLIPSTTNRDERSSSSTQSHNNSQSGSSDHAKTTGFSGKEDARSSTGGSSRPRRSVNGHPGSAPSGSPREIGSSRNFTLPKDLASGKLSQSGLTCEKALDISMTEGSSHKLIVKIPNRGRSPAQNTNVGPVEDPTVMNSRASSPGLSEKNDQSDPDSQEKADDVKTTSDVKTESWESNDFKDILTGSDEGEGSPGAIHEGARNGDEDAKLVETSKVVSNSLGNELNTVSFSSIDVLIESCVKFASISGGDDGGMDLLATVAAGEMSKSDLPSPDVSSGRTRDIQDDCKSSAPDGNVLVPEQCQSEDVLHGTPKHRNPISLTPQKAKEEDAHDSSKLDFKIAVNLCPQINDRSDKIMDIASISTSPTSTAGKVLISDISKQLDEKIETKIKDTKLMENILAVDVKLDNIASRVMVKKETSVGVLPIASSDVDSENKVDVREACNNASYAKQKPSLEAKADVGECNDTSKDFSSKNVDKHDGVKLEDIEGCGGKMTCDEADESKESESSTSHVNKKPKFDLNEGFGADDGKIGYSVNNLGDTGFPVFAHRVNPLPFPVAAAKGPFVPPMDLLKSKRELGWKGSAATSAFRPAEPRKTLETPSVTKHSRPVLDFDLNVADERIVDDVTSRNSVHETASTSAHATVHDFSSKKPSVPPPLPFAVGLDLDFDLNRVDEAGDTWMGSASSCHGSEVPFFPAKLPPSGGYTISESKRDFDLNDGPVVDDPVEPSLHNQHSRNYMQSQPFSSWFPAGNAFPSVTIPSILSDRGDQIQPFPIVTANGPPRILGPATGPIPFPPELYRGSVLSSSPAVPFPSFQYPVFPFGTGFPVPSATPSGVSNTYTDSISNGRLGFAASNSHYPRPYVVSLTDGTNSMSVGNTSKWGRQGLDLNAGPGTVEMEARDDSSSLVSRQFSVASSQALADEQGRMFQQMTSDILKRKENAENFRYKQPSWQ